MSDGGHSALHRRGVGQEEDEKEEAALTSDGKLTRQLPPLVSCDPCPFSTTFIVYIRNAFATRRTLQIACSSDLLYRPSSRTSSLHHQKEMKLPKNRECDQTRATSLQCNDRPEERRTDVQTEGNQMFRTLTRKGKSTSYHTQHSYRARAAWNRRLVIVSSYRSIRICRCFSFSRLN